MKITTPTPAQLTFRKGLERCIAEHGKTLDAVEILAVLSHLVGQVIAVQDQRAMTPEMAMEVVGANLEVGNREVVDSLLMMPAGGRA